MPRLFATGLWVAATVASTVMVWTATSIVAGDVTDRPSVLAHGDVVSELQAATPAAGTTPTSVPPPNSSTSTVASRGRGAAPAGPDAVPTAPASPVPQPGVTAAPSPPATTAMPAPGTPPATRPTSPPTTQPPSRPTATYSTAGGVVRVACSGFLIELISAIPANGYAVNVVSAGPANVDVRFVGPGPDLSVKAVCFNQPIRYDGLPPSRQGPGPT